MRDALGLPGGPTVTGGGTQEYSFFSSAQERVDDSLGFSYWTAAEQSVSQVAANLTALAACQPGESESVCATRFVQAFATKGYRRPLDSTEGDALMAVYGVGRTESFERGLAMAMQAVLQAPSFVYRLELGQRGATPNHLTPFEVASQLSYFFLDTSPDAALLVSAMDGSLATPAGLRAQVDRLLEAPQARDNISRVVGEWFSIREITSLQKDAALFPEWDAALAADLLSSTQAFIRDVLWGRKEPLDSLVTSKRVFVNPRLAALLGVTANTAGPADFVAADFSPDQLRSGILTQPGMLAAVSNVSETSVVHRGLFLRNDVICADSLPSPPPGLLSDPDVKQALSTQTTERERADYRRTNTICVGCHSQIDGYGLLLENFDPIGRFRADNRGVPVDASANLTLSPSLNGVVNGAGPFADGITKDKMFSSCAARQLASYALGQAVPTNNVCEVNAVSGAFANSDGSVASLIREIVLSSFMQTRGAP